MDGARINRHIPVVVYVCCNRRYPDFTVSKELHYYPTQEGLCELDIVTIMQQLEVLISNLVPGWQSNLETARGNKLRK